MNLSLPLSGLVFLLVITLLTFFCGQQPALSTTKEMSYDDGAAMMSSIPASAPSGDRSSVGKGTRTKTKTETKPERYKCHSAQQELVCKELLTPIISEALSMRSSSFVASTTGMLSVLEAALHGIDACWDRCLLTTDSFKDQVCSSIEFVKDILKHKSSRMSMHMIMNMDMPPQCSSSSGGGSNGIGDTMIHHNGGGGIITVENNGSSGVSSKNTATTTTTASTSTTEANLSSSSCSGPLILSDNVNNGNMLDANPSHSEQHKHHQKQQQEEEETIKFICNPLADHASQSILPLAEAVVRLIHAPAAPASGFLFPTLSETAYTIGCRGGTDSSSSSSSPSSSSSSSQRLQMDRIMALARYTVDSKLLNKYETQMSDYGQDLWNLRDNANDNASANANANAGQLTLEPLLQYAVKYKELAMSLAADSNVGMIGFHMSTNAAVLAMGLLVEIRSQAMEQQRRRQRQQQQQQQHYHHTQQHHDQMNSSSCSREIEDRLMTFRNEFLHIHDLAMEDYTTYRTRESPIICRTAGVVSCMDYINNNHDGHGHGHGHGVDYRYSCEFRDRDGNVVKEATAGNDPFERCNGDEYYKEMARAKVQLAHDAFFNDLKHGLFGSGGGGGGGGSKEQQSQPRSQAEAADIVTTFYKGLENSICSVKGDGNVCVNVARGKPTRQSSTSNHDAYGNGT